MSGWILESGGASPVVLRVPAGSTRTIGRTARADLIVDAPLISRLHCRLTADRTGQLTVEDLGSTNGTIVNDERINRRLLQTGDTLRIGRIDFRISRG